MAILYTPAPDAIYCEGESLTEPEHAASCDVNKMIIAASRGQDVRGSQSQAQFGYDDTTMDGLTFRIEKERLERELKQTLDEVDFSDEEEKHIPEEVKKRYKIRKRAASPLAPAAPLSPEPSPRTPAPSV